MASRALVGPLCALVVAVACRPSAGRFEHPDDPVNDPGKTPDPQEPASTAESDPVEPAGPGIAYTRAQKIALARESVPCPDACSRGEARARCTVSPDVRFLDLIAEGSHSHIRQILERSPGIERCFSELADPGAKTLPSFRIPLDFVIGPKGELEAHEQPLYDPDPELEKMLGCVGGWLEGLEFEGAGRSLGARVRLQVEPTGHCAP